MFYDYHAIESGEREKKNSSAGKQKHQKNENVRFLK